MMYVCKHLNDIITVAIVCMHTVLSISCVERMELSIAIRCMPETQMPNILEIETDIATCFGLVQSYIRLVQTK